MCMECGSFKASIVLILSHMPNPVESRQTVYADIMVCTWTFSAMMHFLHMGVFGDDRRALLADTRNVLSAVSLLRSGA